MSLGLGLILHPMCYFSFSLNNGTRSDDETEMYFYNERDRSSNHSPIFAFLCRHKLWSIAELVRGCACRVKQHFAESEIKELACCCRSQAAHRQKEAIFRRKSMFLTGADFIDKD
uniref:Uncharacterized protein n=1 Tax=Ditylenchus dipsaci TaxID=166011 RepID=A0A915ESA4_9BILA